MFKRATGMRRVRPRMVALFLVTISLATGVIAGWANYSSHPDQPISSSFSDSFRVSTEKSFPKLMDEAMTLMNRGMKNAPMTGDPDHDFAAMMIPHHQGAIDMAKVELLYGKDPVLRRLAQEIIVTQEQEIVVMRMRVKQLKAQ